MSVTADRDRPSGTTARTVAQAKLNLFLRVLARESAGYHQLETLFCRLELGDDVTVRVGTGGRSLNCIGDALPPDGLGPVEQNLMFAGHAAFRFRSDPFYSNGFIPTVKQLVDRILTGA